MNNIFEETVKTLTQDAQALQKKVSEYQSKNDFRGALDSMRLLKDTLSLIKEYDWQQKYSEYKCNGKTQVSVWEQNHCGEIRNHKVWNVTENEPNELFDNKWIDLLEHFITNKQSMLFELSYDKDAEKLHRCTGKTTAIEVLAKKYNLPIFTSKYNANRYNEDKDVSDIGRAFYSFGDFRNTQSVNSKIILVDEGCAIGDLDFVLDDGHIIIGFKAVK